jgi:hypothetical protein
MSATPCAGCCDLEDCPCTKKCDEGDICHVHGVEDAAYWAAYFGLRAGMSREERQQQVEAFTPPNWQREV